MKLLEPLKTGCIVELENGDEFITINEHEFMVDAHGMSRHYEDYQNFDHKDIEAYNVAKVTGVDGNVIYKRNGDNSEVMS